MFFFNYLIEIVNTCIYFIEILIVLLILFHSGLTVLLIQQQLIVRAFLIISFFFYLYIYFNSILLLIYFLGFIQLPQILQFLGIAKSIGIWGLQNKTYGNFKYGIKVIPTEMWNMSVNFITKFQKRQQKVIALPAEKK